MLRTPLRDVLRIEPQIIQAGMSVFAAMHGRVDVAFTFMR